VADERTERLARNEARFREINERVERDLAPVLESGDELVPFVCECGRRRCTDTMRMTVSEYESVRADAARFAVVPGHEIDDIEDVMHRTERYAVIRKRPATWDIVEQTSPR
jgi:hypothetical protein